jgi:serine/threonine protein kinase
LATAAATDFPELRLRHRALLDDVFASGDAATTSRSLDIYDNIRLLPNGRHKVLRATLDGNDVVLKRFDVHNDVEKRCFLKEARRLKQLAHPNIVALTGVFVHEQHLPIQATYGYIEMPFYAGGDLWQWLSSTNRSVDERRAVLRQALLGLEHCHRMGGWLLLLARQLSHSFLISCSCRCETGECVC